MEKNFYKHLFIKQLNFNEDMANEIIKYNNNNQIIEKFINISSRARVLTHMKNKYNIDYFEIDDFIPDDKIFKLFNKSDLHKYKFFPVRKDGERIFLATPNIFFNQIFDNIYGDFLPIYTESKNVDLVLSNFYEQKKTNEKEEKSEIDRNIQAILDNVIKTAISKKATDIHFEPFNSYTKCRIRIDGSLIFQMKYESEIYNSLCTIIKIHSKLDISKKLIPLDGHFEENYFGKSYDFRVSTLPTIYGEKIVIRIIYKQEEYLKKENLGFDKKDLKEISNIMESGNGVFLVTGATGSGKTTTLGSFIEDLNTSDVNIITIEDPVEKVIDGVNQVNLNQKAGLTFDSVLPFILRQDPDILMIGEIRDIETGKLALTSSITGHLVLSTLHTNNSVGTITRLLDMGIEPFLISATLKGILTQKLIKRLCNNCKEKAAISSLEKDFLAINENLDVYKSVGCPLCNGTGYRGRFLIYEFLKVDDNIRNLISNNYRADEVKVYLKNRNFTPIVDKAKSAFISGKTSFSEIYPIFIDYLGRWKYEKLLL